MSGTALDDGNFGIPVRPVIPERGARRPFRAENISEEGRVRREREILAFPGTAPSRTEK